MRTVKKHRRLRSSLVSRYVFILFSCCDVTSFVQLTTFGAIQAGNLFAFVPDMSAAQGAGSDIIRLLDSKADIDAESKEEKFVDSKTTRGHIKFDDQFRYPTRPGIRVLHGLSFEVVSGIHVAFGWCFWFWQEHNVSLISLPLNISQLFCIASN